MKSSARKILVSAIFALIAVAFSTPMSGFGYANETQRGLNRTVYATISGYGSKQISQYGYFKTSDRVMVELANSLIGIVPPDTLHIYRNSNGNTEIQFLDRYENQTNLLIGGWPKLVSTTLQSTTVYVADSLAEANGYSRFAKLTAGKDTVLGQNSYYTCNQPTRIVHGSFTMDLSANVNWQVSAVAGGSIIKLLDADGSILAQSPSNPGWPRLYATQNDSYVLISDNFTDILRI